MVYNLYMNIIEVSHLRKLYKRKVAVDDVSFSVEEGTCFGLLGPNGAGKTTTLEVIEDIQTATSGNVYYKGKPRAESFREEIGIQFQHTSLLNYLSVGETLHCYRDLYEKPADLDWVISRCDLTPILSQRNNQLSGGQRQRLMLALALINQPTLIFLDEPSTGLDPQSRRYLWAIIEEIKKEGKTIILTTHSMEEAEILCDTVAIMDMGNIIAEDRPEKLITTHCRTNTITLPFQPPQKVLDSLSTRYRLNGANVAIYTKNVEETIGKLIAGKVSLKEMAVHSPNLEDVFLHLTGKRLRD